MTSPDFLLAPALWNHHMTPSPVPAKNKSPASCSCAYDGRSAIPQLNRVTPLQHRQCPAQRGLAVPAISDERPAYACQARCPAHGQALAHLVLELVDLSEQVPVAAGARAVDAAAAVGGVLAAGRGVHGRGEEEPDGLVDVHFRGDGLQLQLCEGLRDADDGFELADGDGDRGASASGGLGALQLRA